MTILEDREALDVTRVYARRAAETGLAIRRANAR
jgi:hypothetical protein